MVDGSIITSPLPVPLLPVKVWFQHEYNYGTLFFVGSALDLVAGTADQCANPHECHAWGLSGSPQFWRSGVRLCECEVRKPTHAVVARQLDRFIDKDTRVFPLSIGGNNHNSEWEQKRDSP